LFIGSTLYSEGAIDVRSDLEKSYGSPEAKIPPRLPKFTHLPKLFFSQDNPKEPICPAHLCIIRMKLFFDVPAIVFLGL
jgi:hypothetical protein